MGVSKGYMSASKHGEEEEMGREVVHPCGFLDFYFVLFTWYHRKGLSQSALPYRRSVPNWLKLSAEDVKEQIYKLSKKGLTPSQIGVILRDSHGVAQVRFVTGNKILRILKSKGLAPTLPEDLYCLIKKAVSVRKHLERNRKVRECQEIIYYANLLLHLRSTMGLFTETAILFALFEHYTLCI